MMVSKFYFKASFLPKRKKMSTQSYKNVVVISVGTTASRIASRIRKNAKIFGLLSLSFVGIGLDKNEKKFEGLELDRKLFFREEIHSKGRWSAYVIAGVNKVLPEMEEILLSADYVLVLTTGITRSWVAASAVMKMLEEIGLPFSALTKVLSWTGLWYEVPLTFKYRNTAIRYFTFTHELALREDWPIAEREVFEDSTYQSMVEGALEAICSTKGAPVGSNLFEEIFLDGERVWFMYGSASGEGRADVALKQAKKYLVGDETRFDKVFLYVKADNLLDEEVQTIKGEIAQCLKKSELIIAVSKTNCAEGFLTISLFCRAK